MSSTPAEFEAELALFRAEAESAIQFFYAWQSINAIASGNKAVLRLLNEAPLFWNTNIAALQASALVAMGRIFDPDPKNHSVTRLLSLAHSNLSVFSKDALAARKRKQSSNADEWLAEYLVSAYVPTTEDFRRLKRHVAKRRLIYEEKYRPLRHKVFAHRGVSDKAEVNRLFAKTAVREMQQLLTFLARLHETLWQLYFNGRKPSLRPARFSVKQILEKPSPNFRSGSVQERLVSEAQKFLTKHSKLSEVNAPFARPEEQKKKRMKRTVD